MTTKQAKARRKALGLNLEKLAVRIGVTGPTLWRWEEGRATPHRIMLARWEEALGEAEKKLPISA